MEWEKPKFAGPESALPTSDTPKSPGRRSFFGIMIGVGSVFVGALLSVPLIRFAISPLLAPTGGAAWSDLGAWDQFASISQPVRRTIPIRQVDGWLESVSQKPVYVVKGNRKGSEDGVEVLSSICPHLGCEVPWDPKRGVFACPCHNSVFAPDGARISGPARRGMDTLPIKIVNGRLQVRFEYFQQLEPYKEVMG